MEVKVKQEYETLDKTENAQPSTKMDYLSS